MNKKIKIHDNFSPTIEYLEEVFKYFNIHCFINTDFRSSSLLDKLLSKLQEYLTDEKWVAIQSASCVHYWNSETGDLLYIDDNGTMCVFPKKTIPNEKTR